MYAQNILILWSVWNVRRVTYSLHITEHTQTLGSAASSGCVPAGVRQAWSRPFTGTCLVSGFCTGSFTGGLPAMLTAITSRGAGSEPLTLAATVPMSRAGSWTPNHSSISRFQEQKNVVFCQNNPRHVRRSGFTGVCEPVCAVCVRVCECDRKTRYE